VDSENSENGSEKSPDALSFKRLYIEVRDEEIESAIDYLVSNIPEDTLKKAFDLFQQDVELIRRMHFGLGMDVRNLLYRGNIDLGGTNLDDNWVYLLWKASEMVCGKKD
jgi:hypothetical protein